MSLRPAADASTILLSHNMPPNRNCHIQAHVAFTAWSQSAVPEGQENSTRLQSVRNRVMLPLSWSLATLCPLSSLIACSREMPGCPLMTYHIPLPWTPCFFNAIPVLNPALPGARMALSPKASWIAASTAKASKGHSQRCTALGGLQNTQEARVLSRLWWPTRWHLGMAPSMATWQLCS